MGNCPPRSRVAEFVRLSSSAPSPWEWKRKGRARPGQHSNPFVLSLSKHRFSFVTLKEKNGPLRLPCRRSGTSSGRTEVEGTWTYSILAGEGEATSSLHAPGQERSEEHTSELPSPMRISYA